ncbi:MAG: ABC transporter ATP-binding protein [Pseudomonadota bacterium]
MPAASPYWEVVAAPFALHWSNETEHRHVVLLGLERTDTDGSMWGAAAFRNSFGQPSAYGYYGHVWEGVLNQPKLYTKLSGGVLYGYKGQYKNKVPFNRHGFGLAVIPAVGWRLSPRDALQVSVLGTAALIFSYNRRF